MKTLSHLSHSLQYTFSSLRTFFAKKGQEDLLGTLSSEEQISSSMDKFFGSLGLHLAPFSLDGFIEHTFYHNNRLLKRLKDFLKEQGIGEDYLVSHEAILQQWKIFTQQFTQQDIFLSRQFTPEIYKAYTEWVKTPLKKEICTRNDHFLLQKYFRLYKDKLIKKKKNLSEELEWRTERVGIRCFEDIDRKLLKQLDPTSFSQEDQEKLKKTFFYKTAFPHFCSHAAQTFKRSLCNSHDIRPVPHGIFLVSEKQLLYTKPDQENLSALDLTKSREESLLALNDFDFLLIHSLYRDHTHLPLKKLREKYAPYGTLTKRDSVVCFERNEEIMTTYPGKTAKPERLEDRSLDEDKNSDILLLEAFTQANAFAKHVHLTTSS